MKKARRKRYSINIALISILVVGGLALLLSLSTNAKSTTPDLPDKPLAIGSKAPDFNLEATGGKRVKLSQYRGRNVILVFYPMDQTPGCTAQLCALRDTYETFQELSTDVLASNPADLKSHEAFVQKQHYPFPIAVDKDREMAKAYGVKDLVGINARTVFIVDKRGIIRFSEEGMPSPSTLAQAIKKFPK